MSAITLLNLVSPFVTTLSASGGNLTAPLSPSSALIAGNFYYFKRTDTSSFYCALTASAGDAIDGASSYNVVGKQGVLLYNTGTEYLVLSAT